MGCTLEELDDNTCRFPIGEPGEDGFHFCGEAPIAFYPYCARHVCVAYRVVRTTPWPALDGYTCAPCNEVFAMFLSPPWRERRRQPSVVDAGVGAAAEIFARHRQVRARLLRGARPATRVRLEPRVAAPCASAPRPSAPSGRVAREPRWLAIPAIVQAVAAFYGVSAVDIASARRAPDLVRARHVAWFLCRRLTPHSSYEIGRNVGGRDHAAVLHGVRGIARRIGTDADLAAQVVAVETRLTRGAARDRTDP